MEESQDYNWDNANIAAHLIEHSPLEEVYIFFDTVTYDEIERDVKVKFESSSKQLPVPI